MINDSEIKRIKDELESKREIFALNSLAESEWNFVLQKVRRRVLHEKEETLGGKIIDFFSGIFSSYKLSLVLATLILLLSSFMIYKNLTPANTQLQGQSNSKHFRSAPKPNMPGHNVSAVKKHI